MHVEAMVAVGLQASHFALDADLVTVVHETDRALGLRTHGGLQLGHGLGGALRTIGSSNGAVLMGAVLMGAGRDRQRGQHGQGHPLDRECHLGFS